LDPLVKAMLNSLRCPVCGGQVDLVDWKVKSPGRKYNFCCVANWEHYRIFFVHWEPVLRIEYETVVVYEGRHQYWITQYDDNGNNNIEIIVSEVDAENRVVDTKKPSRFSYDKKLFDFSKTNRERIVNRVKTILVFQ
jgi:hypothetical protein